MGSLVSCLERRLIQEFLFLERHKPSKIHNEGIRYDFSIFWGIENEKPSDILLLTDHGQTALKRNING